MYKRQVVREKLGYQDKEFVTVEGLVKIPGNYAIKDNNYTVYDLVQDFGGFLKDASLDGVKIVRENKLEDILNEEEEEEEEDSAKLFGQSNQDSLNIRVNIKPFRVMVHELGLHGNAGHKAPGFIEILELQRACDRIPALHFRPECQAGQRLFARIAL